MSKLSSTRKPGLIWLNVAIFTLTGLITLIGVPYYAMTHGFDGWQISAMIAGVIFCEISITAGYHRLWSHHAYDAHWLVKTILMIGGTFATQNSILHWSSDHRMHHRHVDDNNKDPYSAKRGFWYSHMGWMLREYDTHNDNEYKNCQDLKRDPVVMWQHRNYLPMVLGLNFGIPLLLGLLHGDIIGMLLLAGVARLAISHHMTFFINSLAHVWGSQPYSDTNSSKDNGFIAFLTMGEGYHNYHHSFQRDYRNGILWWQFDPTKWLIRSLAFLGLAKNLYQAPLERIETMRAQMLLINTRQRLVQSPYADAFYLRLQKEYDLLMDKINEFSKAKNQWIEAQKKMAAESCDLEALTKKVEILKKSFLQQKKNWLVLNASMAPGH